METIKKWVLGRKFVREVIKRSSFRAFEAGKKKGGVEAFPLAHKDIMETVADDLDKKAEVLANKKLNDLLSPVDLTTILTVDKDHGFVFIGGEKVPEGRLKNLKSEADYLIQSDIWKLLYNTPKELASRAMFVTSESLDDMKKGKSILYTLSTQKNILETLQKLSTPKTITRK